MTNIAMRRTIITCLSLLTLAIAPLSAQDTKTKGEASQQTRQATATQQIPMREVKGRVVEATTRQPIAGVLVSVAEIEGYSTLTETDGTFTLRVPTAASSLSFSFSMLLPPGFSSRDIIP